MEMGRNSLEQRTGSEEALEQVAQSCEVFAWKRGAAKLKLHTWYTNTTPYTLKLAWEFAVL